MRIDETIAKQILCILIGYKIVNPGRVLRDIISVVNDWFDAEQYGVPTVETDEP